MGKAEEGGGGKVRGMTREEMEDFLKLGVNMYLACLAPEGDPYITVCWHEWRDGHFWVIPPPRSAWAEFLARKPRGSFVIEQPNTLGKGIGRGRSGPVGRPDGGGPWGAIATPMTYRCLGENGPTYLEPTLNQPRWLFKIKPEKLQTWQGVGWAPKYWVSGTGGPSYEEAHTTV